MAAARCVATFWSSKGTAEEILRRSSFQILHALPITMGQSLAESRLGANVNNSRVVAKRLIKAVGHPAQGLATSLACEIDPRSELALQRAVPSAAPNNRGR